MSSGYNRREKGIVGSLKGTGVILSWNMGTLIATFRPRRDRMLAVNVRKRGWVLITSSGRKKLLAAGPGGSKCGSVKS